MLQVLQLSKFCLMQGYEDIFPMYSSKIFMGFPVDASGKRIYLPMQEMQEMQDQTDGSLGWKVPRGRKWHPTPVLSGKFHGQRSLVGYSPRVHKESVATERLSILLKYSQCQLLHLILLFTIIIFVCVLCMCILACGY